MDTPKWLKEELRNACRPATQGRHITRENAIAEAAKLVRTKRTPSALTSSAPSSKTGSCGRFNYYEERARREAVDRGRITTTTGTTQGTFDEVPDFLPIRLFSSLSTLDDVWIYHEQQAKQTQNFVRIDEEREAWLVARTAAVDGDRMTTLGQAEKGLASHGRRRRATMQPPRGERVAPPGDRNRHLQGLRDCLVSHARQSRVSARLAGSGDVRRPRLHAARTEDGTRPGHPGARAMGLDAPAMRSGTGMCWRPAMICSLGVFQAG